MAVTLYDVARAAGVSIATVSRVVHGQDRVRAATRHRVREAIEALGYVPDAAAQSMARQRKEIIGLVAVESRDPDTDVEQDGLLFIEEVLRGVEQALRPIGWSVLISVLISGGADAYRQLQRISAKVDGLLICEGIVDSEHLALLAARVPVVLIAGPAAEPSADVVTADNHGGTVTLVRHLISRHGARRFHYLAGPAEAPDANARRRAFEQAVADCPGAVVTASFQGRFAAISGQRAVRAMLGQELPDVIVCGNDQMAIGAIRELQAAGIRVPLDVAVTGFDDIHLSALLTPTLTTVRQPMRQLGERGCACLLDRIADPGRPRVSVELPTELIVRTSCGCLLPSCFYRAAHWCQGIW